MAFQRTPQTPRQEVEAKLAAKQFKAQEAKRAFNEYEATARAVDEIGRASCRERV